MRGNFVETCKILRGLDRVEVVILLLGRISIKGTTLQEARHLKQRHRFFFLSEGSESPEFVIKKAFRQDHEIFKMEMDNYLTELEEHGELM